MGARGDSRKRKVVVIGAGVGGAAVAALLAKSGFDVVLLEQHPFQGGRCATLAKGGFHYDFGVHMFSRGDRGPHGEVSRAAEGGLEWITRDPPCHVMGKVEFDFPLDINPLRRQAYLASKLKIRPAHLPGSLRLFLALRSRGPVEAHDGVTLHEFVSRYTSDDNVHLFMNCLCQLYFALSYKEASAGEFIWCFSRMFRDASFGYPRGGGSAIPGSSIGALRKHGGRVVYNAQVTGIMLKNGTAVGVRAGGKIYPADIVISNAGIARTIEMAGIKQFPASYTERAESLVYSNAYITIKYALDRPVVPYPVVFYMPDMPGHSVFDYIKEKSVPDDPYIFMPVPSNMDPGLAPVGKQIVIAGTAAPAGSSKKYCEAVIERVDRKVCQLFPGIKPATIWKSHSIVGDTARLTRHPAGECIGLGQVPGQTGAGRPGHETPVRNLWLVGADAGARGIGTEIASESALRLAEIITGSDRGAARK